MTFKWKTAAKDIAICIVGSPILFPASLILLVSGPRAWRRAYHKIRIHWGIHPCSDGHNWEYTETKRDLVSRERLTEDGLEYEVHDTEKYDCSNCYHTKAEYINERPKKIDAREL